MLPPERITSRAASAAADCPRQTYSTPTARRPSNRMRHVSALVSTVRFGRSRAGRRNALAVLQRRPSFWVSW